MNDEQAARPHRPMTDGERFWDNWQRRRRGSAPRGVKRIAALCERLGDPQEHLDVVHVVGTDAKTSTTLMIAGLLRAAGVTAGATISPHLESVRERILIDGATLGWDQWEELARRIAPIAGDVERALGQSPSFFELVTTAALLSFAEHPVQVAVVEAGIGGSSDATALIRPATVVLTPVGRDHPQLGATLRQITREKVGVAPPGSRLVCASQVNEVAATVAQVAVERSLRVVSLGEDFGVVERRPTPHGQWVRLRGVHGETFHGFLHAHGAHQAANAAVALATVQVHHAEHTLEAATVSAWLSEVSLEGRNETVVWNGCDVILDGAHDALAARALATVIGERAARRRPVYVMATTSGRSLDRLLADLPPGEVIITAVSAPVADDPWQLSARLAHGDAGGHRFSGVEEDPAEAMRRAASLAGVAGLIVVSGSLMLVGDVRRWLRSH